MSMLTAYPKFTSIVSMLSENRIFVYPTLQSMHHSAKSSGGTLSQKQWDPYLLLKQLVQ